jgi:hypothetical protein
MSFSPIFSHDITATVDETAYAITGWSTVVARFGSVGVLTLVGVLFVLCRRPERLRSVLWVAVLAGVFVAGVAGLAASPGVYGPRHVLTLFRPLGVGDAVAIVVGAGAGFGAFVAMVVSSPSRAVIAFGIATMGAAGGLVAASRRDAQALAAFGDLPFFVAKGRDDLHVGRERDVAVELDYLAPPSGFWIFAQAGGPRPLEPSEGARWSPPPSVHVRAEVEGRFPVTVTARRGPVALTSTLWFRGRREAASPVLPLRVGNRWVYRVVTKKDTGHELLRRTGGEENDEPSFEMEVTREGERDGFRTFTIETRGGGAAGGVTKVMALEGQTLFALDDGTEGAAAVEVTGDLTAADPIGCRPRLLGIKSATCQRGGAAADELPPPRKRAPARRGHKPEPAPGPLRFALGGPLSFSTHKGDINGAIATGVVAVITLGLVAPPDRSTTTTYTLMETHPGPEGAPAAQ